MSSKTRVSNVENGLYKKEKSSLSKFVQLLLKMHFIPVRVFTKEGRASFRLFSSTSLIHIFIYFGFLGKHSKKRMCQIVENCVEEGVSAKNQNIDYFEMMWGQDFWVFLNSNDWNVASVLMLYGWYIRDIMATFGHRRKKRFLSAISV